MSGHTFFKERWYGFDDALYAGVRLVQILANNPSTTLAELKDRLPTAVNTPELRFSCPEERKFQVVEEVNRAKEEGVEKTILFNLCGHGHFDMQAYIDFFGGKLKDLEYDEAELAMALAGLPSMKAA